MSEDERKAPELHPLIDPSIGKVGNSPFTLTMGVIHHVLEKLKVPKKVRVVIVFAAMAVLVIGGVANVQGPIGWVASLYDYAFHPHADNLHLGIDATIMDPKTNETVNFYNNVNCPSHSTVTVKVTTEMPAYLLVVNWDGVRTFGVGRSDFHVQRTASLEVPNSMDDHVGTEYFFIIGSDSSFTFDQDIAPHLKALPINGQKGSAPIENPLQLPDRFSLGMRRCNHTP